MEIVLSTITDLLMHLNEACLKKLRKLGLFCGPRVVVAKDHQHYFLVSFCFLPRTLLASATKGYLGIGAESAMNMKSFR